MSELNEKLSDLQEQWLTRQKELVKAREDVERRLQEQQSRS